MQDAVALVADDLRDVERAFRAHLKSDVPLIGEIGAYLLASGGKRIRPLALLLSARAFGPLEGRARERAVLLASIVEFIHTATLLHDDVVDNAVLRRGNASANAVWGNEASVLVGDFIFSKSFRLMVEDGDIRILRVLSDATTRMAEGEVAQLLHTSDVDLTEEEYVAVVVSKTAILLAAACRIGAILGGAAQAAEGALAEFGLKLGIAFQLMDDYLDYVSREADLGKQVGKDLEEGMITLPLLHALRQCTPAERTRVAAILAADELRPAQVGEVVELVFRYGGPAYTRQRAEAIVAEAKRSLLLLPPSEAREALAALAAYVIERDR
ncbi:MAG TPA: polyprenyl synthetase family protein [Thermodesulfobacteriota bacterium]|nr:polyprenyl synthetase family protein [Thermodesulfobacteriota bacterium]